MMNLMIVEDEPRLRNNLAFDIPWEEHGISVVGLAASGEEVLELFDRKKPDILLLDIQMPGMNGIELAKRVHEKDRLVKMIILSGHDSFQYACQALELGVSKYLLKPAGDTEILEAVKQAASELREQLDRLHHVSLLQEKWNQHLPYLRETFLLNWLHGKYSPAEIEKRSRDLLLETDQIRLFCVAVVEMDPSGEEDPRLGAEDTSLLQLSLKSICQETLARDGERIATDTNGGAVIVFATTEPGEADAFLQEVNASVGKLLGIVKECLKRTASAGISGTTARRRELNKLYEQAREALQKRVVYGNHIAVTYRDRFEQAPRQLSYPDIERELETGLDTGNEARCLQAFGKLWRFIMAEEGQRPGSFSEGRLYFISLLVRLIQQRGCCVRDVIDAEPDPAATKEQLYDYLSGNLLKFLGFLNKRRGAAGHRIVEAALNMIEEGIEEDLSLHSVAERLFINSSYLSRLFKQEIGKPFSAYVLERKMELAKSSLLAGAKVYDAARAAGYRDVSYFTKVFRRYWKVTPGEVARA